jgi:hypothetical protein
MPRIFVIRKSLTAFVCGLIGFLPIIGVLPGLYALLCWSRIRTRYPGEWNPASAYLSWGVRLAVIGLGLSTLIVSIALVTLVY